MKTILLRNRRAVTVMLSLMLGASLILNGCTRRAATPAATKAPERIVSLAPSVTEILYAVGAGECVIATDDYSDYPPQAREKPHIGGVVVNYERIVALRPDLVIGVQDLQGASIERLRKLGLNVLAIDTTSFDKTVAAIRQVGAATGGPDAGNRVAADLELSRSDIQTRYAGRPGASVLAVAEAEPSVVAMGKGTFWDDLLTLAGGTNAASVMGFAPLSREVLAGLHPDLVLVGSADEASAMRRRFVSLPGKPPRVDILPPDILVRPGPRLGQGLRWLAKEVHNVPAGGSRS